MSETHKKTSSSLARRISLCLCFLGITACSLLDFEPENGYPEYQSKDHPYPQLIPNRDFEFDSNPALEPLYTEDQESVLFPEL